MVRKALSIVLAASRPLTVLEMNIAINIADTAHNITTRTFNDLNLEDECDFKSRLRSWCGLFISIYHGKVYFLHQTAREFLREDLASPPAIPSEIHWQHSITICQAHHVLAEIYVLYLDLFNFGLSPAIVAEGNTSCLRGKDGLLNYSAVNWEMHFRNAQVVNIAAILPAALRIYNPDSKSFSIWFKAHKGSTDNILNKNMTSLILASYFGHTSIAQLLIGKGANIDARDGSSYTALSWAVIRGHMATAQLLIENGADIEASDTYKTTPLVKAVRNGDEAIAQLLIEKGADIEAKEFFNNTPLLEAAKNGHKAIAKLLIEEGADIEARDVNMRTPLLWAVKNGHEALTQLLIEKGADIEARDVIRRTPLLQAAKNGNEAIAQLLIERGADIEASDTYKTTPLVKAVRNGNEVIAQLLIKEGADIKERDFDSQTLLLIAVKRKHMAIAQLLIKEGADTTAVRGKTL